MRKWLRPVLGLLVGCGFVWMGDGLCGAEGRPGGTYVTHRWQVRDGLAHPVVYNMVQTERGYMWLATFGGMMRFDGRDFSIAGSADAPVGPRESIRNIALADSGTLIVLPQAGGVFRFRNGAFAEHPVSSKVRELSLVDLFVGRDDVLWLGAADGTLVRWEAGRTRRFDLTDGLTDAGVRFSFAVDGAGRTWVSRGRFLGSFEDGELVPFSARLGEGIFICAGNDGRLWVGSTEGLFRFDGATVEEVALDREWPALRSGLTQLFEDSDGSLWVGTRRQGLLRVHDGRLRSMDDYYEFVSSILEDSEGNLWITFEGGGIARLRTRDLLVLDSIAGLPRDVSLSVCVDESGAVWCANRSGGLVRYRDGDVQRFTTAAGAIPFATAVCPDRQGRIWVGTDDGAFVIDVADPRFLERQPGAYGVVSLLYCADNRDMWVNSSRGGVRVYRDRQLLRDFGPAQGVPATRLSGIAQDRAGRIWISTLSGQLLRLADDGAVFEPQEPNVPGFDGDIFAIHRDSHDDLWLGTSQGLMFWRDSEHRLLEFAEGIPDAMVSQVLDDGENLWLGTRGGLWYATLGDLHAVINGDQEAVAGVFMGENEGLPVAASLPTMQPRAWRDGSGHLWFATYAGVIGVNPDNTVTRRPAPPVYIDEIYLDGTAVSDPTGFAVPAGRHAVEFRFSAPTYTAPHLVRLRHKLAGFDVDWVRTPDDRFAQYARLPPGRYELRVAVRNVDGEWGTNEASLSFEVLPAWWQNPWILSGGAGLLLIAGVLAVRTWAQRRLKRHIHLLEREQALDRERSRIARDLHDDVGTRLTRIGFIAERLRRHSPAGETKDGLDQLATQTRRLAVDLESIVWTVNPKNQTWDRFALYLSRYAQELFRDTGIRCVVSGDDNVPRIPLPPDAQRHLLAVYKEALNNVVKHARARRVEVNMALEEGRFRLQVGDDGVGFDPQGEKDSVGNGLRNMRSRLREMGGAFNLDSSPDAGTRVVCTVRASPTERC